MFLGENELATNFILQIIKLISKIDQLGQFFKICENTLSFAYLNDSGPIVARYKVSVASHMQEKKMNVMPFVKEALLEGRKKNSIGHKEDHLDCNETMLEGATKSTQEVFILRKLQEKKR